MYSDYSSPCHDNELFATGNTEKQQMLRFVSDSVINQAVYFPIKKIFISFSVAKLTTTDCCTVIRLVDMRRENIETNATFLQLGGASLHTVAVSERRLFSCPFIDYFNGTYEVVCRLYEECHNISILLSYIDYGAFSWDGNLIAKTLFSRSVCRRQSGLKHDFGTYVGWFRDNVNLSWKWVRGHKDTMIDSWLRSCIAQLPSPVLLLGD